jgi:hypothetical protein
MLIAIEPRVKHRRMRRDAGRGKPWLCHRSAKREKARDGFSRAQLDVAPQDAAECRPWQTLALPPVG